MMEYMKSIMDVPVSCLLPWRKSRHCVVSHSGTSVGVTGPAVILIKRIFICALLICMAEAIREREGRNELGEKGIESN